MHMLLKSHNKFLFFLRSTFLAVYTFVVVGFPGVLHAESEWHLPPVGTMITPSEQYDPAVVMGITIYPNNPLQLDFMINTGDDHLQGEAFEQESKKLVNYFFATLTVPDDEMWVNLSPYEKDRIIAEGLSITEMGRDMLIQDYMLKQLTASLMYPEEELGEEFWKKVYEKADAQFGTTDIPANTFNKVWIVPDRASVYIEGTNVFVNQSHLKVYLEEDYLALESNVNSTKHGLGEVSKNDIEAMSKEAKDVIREVIIPEIEKEVNTGKNFANLRQIYHSMILATWYKKNLKESILGHIYMDRNKVQGINIKDKQIKEKVYQQYVEAFKKGVYDYIRQDYDPVLQEIVPKKYFSGGLENIDEAMIGNDEGPSQELLKRFSDGSIVNRVSVRSNPLDRVGEVIDYAGRQESSFDAAMVANPQSVAELIQRMSEQIRSTPYTTDASGERMIVPPHTLGTSLTQFNLRDFKTAQQKISVIREAGLLLSPESRANFLRLSAEAIANDPKIHNDYEYAISQLLAYNRQQEGINDHGFVLDERFFWRNPQNVGGKMVHGEFDGPAAYNALRTVLFFGSRGELRPVEDIQNDIAYFVDRLDEDTMVGAMRALFDAKIERLEDGISEAEFMMGGDPVEVVVNLLDSMRLAVFYLLDDFATRPDLQKELADEIRGKYDTYLKKGLMYGDATVKDKIQENMQRLNEQVPEDSGDLAMTSKEALGGIDFNPQNLDLQEKGQAIDFTLDDGLLQSIPANTVEGMAPVIIHISPITNFSLLLGLADDPVEQQLSSL